MHSNVEQGQNKIRRRATTRETILVIEDERFVRDITCEILRDAGYRVLQAESALRARSVFLRHRKRIQLLLCDAVLPDSSGVALAQILGRRSSGVKVILTSGYPRGTFLGDLDATSGNKFLAKPYGAASLVSVVKMALQKEGATEPAI